MLGSGIGDGNGTDKFSTWASRFRLGFVAVAVGDLISRSFSSSATLFVLKLVTVFAPVVSRRDSSLAALLEAALVVELVSVPVAVVEPDSDRA